MRYMAFPLCVLAVMIASCDYDAYELKLTPQGDTMTRQLTVYRVTQASSGATAPATAQSQPATASAPATMPAMMAEEKLKELDKVYSKRFSAPDDARQVFVGQFKGAMPNDVGGSGTYTALPSEMGDTYVYLERFRGNPNPGVRTEEMIKAADELTDLLVGWFESELGKEKGFADLRAYMDKDFRRAMKDMTLYYGLAEAGLQAKDAGDELAARAAQYVFENDLLTPKELAALLGNPQGLFSEDAARGLLSLAQRKAALKMGMDADKPRPASLAFLDYDQVSDSISKYILSSKLYQAYELRVKKEQATRSASPPAEFHLSGTFWRQELPTQPASPHVEVHLPPTSEPAPATEPASTTRPSIQDFVQERFMSLAPSFSGDTDDRLLVQLDLPREPLKTNGRWDAASKSVAWDFHLSGTDGAIWPRVCYALWTQPDDKAQTLLFGKVVLDGEDLRDYCQIRSGMSAGESARWLDAVKDLSAAKLQEARTGDQTDSQTLVAMLKDFREASWRAATQAASRRAATQTASRPAVTQ